MICIMLIVGVQLKATCKENSMTTYEVAKPSTFSYEQSEGMDTFVSKTSGETAIVVYEDVAKSSLAQYDFYEVYKKVNLEAFQDEFINKLNKDKSDEEKASLVSSTITTYNNYPAFLINITIGNKDTLRYLSQYIIHSDNNIYYIAIRSKDENYVSKDEAKEIEKSFIIKDTTKKYPEGDMSKIINDLEDTKNIKPVFFAVYLFFVVIAILLVMKNNKNKKETKLFLPIILYVLQLYLVATMSEPMLKMKTADDIAFALGYILGYFILVYIALFLVIKKSKAKTDNQDMNVDILKNNINE